MLRHDPNYRRLDVRARSPLSSASYWLAADHLLVVEVAGITERYRRFELRDIQAVVITPVRTRLWWNLGLGGLLVLVMSYAGVELGMDVFSNFTGYGGVIAILVFGGIMAALLAALAMNAIRGPGGRLTLTTAVQSITLPGITRWRQAERLLAELGAAARASQHAIAVGVDQVPAPADASTPTEPAVPGTSP